MKYRLLSLENLIHLHLKKGHLDLPWGGTHVKSTKVCKDREMPYLSNHWSEADNQQIVAWVGTQAKGAHMRGYTCEVEEGVQRPRIVKNELSKPETDHRRKSCLSRYSGKRGTYVCEMRIIIYKLPIVAYRWCLRRVRSFASFPAELAGGQHLNIIQT